METTREQRPWAIRVRLLLLYLLCTAATASFSIHQYRSFRCVWPRDLAHVNHATWCLAHGVHVLSIRPHNHYAAEGPEPLRSVHLDPIRYLVLPAYSLYPQPETLLIFQSAIFWLSIFGVAELAEKNRWLAALLWAITPAGFGLAMNDFRTMELGFPFVLWAIAAFERRQVGWFIVHALLACSARQEYGAAIGMLALMPAQVGEPPRRIWRWRIAVIAWAVAWWALYVIYVYILFGFRSVDILLTEPAQRPPASWEMWGIDSTRLVVALLLLLGGWWLFIPGKPRYLLMAAPFLFSISRFSNLRFMPGDDNWHLLRYYAIPLAFCLAGGVIGLRNSRIPNWTFARKTALIAGLWLAPLASCVVSVLSIGYLSGNDGRETRAWIQKIPRDAWVFSDAHFVAMSSSRAMVRDAYDFEHDNLQLPPEVDAWAILLGGSLGDYRSPRFVEAGFEFVFRGERVSVLRRSPRDPR